MKSLRISSIIFFFITRLIISETTPAASSSSVEENGFTGEVDVSHEHLTADMLSHSLFQDAGSELAGF
jgi:hypothetical protein